MGEFVHSRGNRFGLSNEQVAVGECGEVLVVGGADSADAGFSRPVSILVDTRPSEERRGDIRRVPSVFGGGVPDLSQPSVELRRIHHVGHPYVSVSAGAAQRGGFASAEPEWWSATLTRWRVEGQPGHGGELAGKSDGLPAQQLADDLQTLLSSTEAGGGFNARGDKFGRILSPRADTKLETTLRDDIDSGGELSDHRGRVERQQSN